MRNRGSIELALIAESMKLPASERSAWILQRKAEIAHGGPEPAPYQPEGFTAKPFADVADDPVIARLCAEGNK
ncbi:MAG: hypothetical protein NUW22_05080 [Acidobacteria bacterium]|nr:hypothetical protein [Acidobacteriota bacterium]